MVAVAVDHASPAEVAVEVFRCDTAETDHPALQSARVRIDVLDVIALPDVLAFRGDDPDMQQRAGLGERRVGFLDFPRKSGGLF